MGFLSILKTVGTTILGIEKVAAPVIGALVPGAAPILGIFDRLQAAITAVEAGNPLQNGALKAAAVKADFEAGLGLTQSILAAQKKKLAYDESALQDAIDKQVAAFNAMAAVHSSFKVVDL